MKRYIYTLLVGAIMLLTSCVTDDTFFEPNNYTPSPDSGLQFIAAVEDFDIHYVGTRADGEVSDSYITEMTMLIFDSNGKMLPAYTGTGFSEETKCSSHIHIEKSNPTFLIEATKYENYGILASMETSVEGVKYYDNTADDLDACSIYIVANAWHLIGERLEAGEIEDLSDLEATLIDTDATLAMPINNTTREYIGLPMIGTHTEGTFNLSYNAGEQQNSIATIPLKKLYSKVEFTIQVKSNQIVTGQTPKFTLEDIEIYNIPSQIRMSHVDGDYVANVCGEDLTEGNIAKWYLYNSVDGTPMHLDLPSKTTAYHDTSLTTDEKIEFVFYMPEHMVTPNTIQYPANITDEFKQYYKPKGVQPSSGEGGISQGAKIAPYVRIIGSYTDHNAQINKVSYDIYLGQNEVDDFEVKRNQRLCNFITITGLTNHKDAYPDVAGNVSIDHRVTMTSKGYNLSMEREAILDAHFEVRPLDVELSPGGSMTVVIPAEYKKMIAFESDAAAREATGDAKNLYIDNSKERKGVRKYFTTNLVTELWEAGNTDTETGNLTLTLKHSGKDNSKTEIHRIWFYVDENPHVYDKSGEGKLTSETGDYTVTSNLYRLAKVNFYYAADNATPDLSAEPSSTINFQQWNLWRVWNTAGTRYYDIEHEEEYLNNYASDQLYGSTHNGMAWGLDGVQLSNKYDAAMMHVLGEGIIQSIIRYFDIEETYNGALSKLTTKPLYDFYLPRDISGDGYTIRSYSGFAFNTEIATTLKENYASQQIAHTNSQGYLAQIEKLTLTQAPSSAFAYCYHKNKRNANGDVVEQKWFLPAIDEIEEIAVGAYDEFDQVFQNQKYWSCQPAFDSRLLHLDLKWMGSVDVADLEADYYIDDTNRARATAAMYDGIDDNGNLKYKPLSSGTPGYSGTQTGTCNATIFSGTTIDLEENCKFTDFTDQQFIDSGNEGNLPRTQSCRIRAVYRSGTK